jgi:hypothetical protein
VISPSQGRYLHTGQHKHRINAHGHPCFEWDSNPRSQRSKTVHALDGAATVVGLYWHTVLLHPHTSFLQIHCIERRGLYLHVKRKSVLDDRVLCNMFCFKSNEHIGSVFPITIYNAQRHLISMCFNTNACLLEHTISRSIVTDTLTKPETRDNVIAGTTNRHVALITTCT